MQPTAERVKTIWPLVAVAAGAWPSRRRHGTSDPFRGRANREDRIAELTAILADPSLYARDRARFAATAKALAAARGGLAAAEEQWLRLELLREEIEAAEPR